MALDAPRKSLAGPASRRAVVAQGVKLGYAAPLIAASFKLSSLGAQAISGHPGPDPVCNGQDACSGTPTCGQPGSLCSCSTLVGGGGLCRPTVFDCGTPVGCNSNADCEAKDPTRTYCVVADHCCPQQGFAGVCTSRCPTP